MDIKELKGIDGELNGDLVVRAAEANVSIVGAEVQDMDQIADIMIDKDYILAVSLDCDRGELVCDYETYERGTDGWEFDRDHEEAILEVLKNSFLIQWITFLFGDFETRWGFIAPERLEALRNEVKQKCKELIPA